jgi:hypothetical protein
VLSASNVFGLFVLPESLAPAKRAASVGDLNPFNAIIARSKFQPRHPADLPVRV